jgi:hypothetical protein
MFPQTIQDWVEQANVNDQGSNINARRHFEGWSLGLCLNFVKDDSIDREVEKQFVGEAPDNLNNWRVIENNDAEMKFAKTERYSKGIYAFKIDLPSTTILATKKQSISKIVSKLHPDYLLKKPVREDSTEPQPPFQDCCE